ncbi:MAG: YibE/F family protein [Candidatus Falkowbacteria bacterium]
MIRISQIKKLLIIILFFSGIFFASPVQAQEQVDLQGDADSAQAVVLKVLEEKNLVRENGQTVKQQNLELGIVTGSLKGQKYEYNGISSLDVVSSNAYKVNDKVVVNYSRGDDGKYVFYVTDYVRSSALLWLLILFVATILAIGGTKGFRSLLSLLFSFIVIMKILVPLVLKGYNPLAVGLIIATMIALAIIYLTDGWNKKSHLAVVSILLSLMLTAILSIVFSSLSRLTGTAQEEVTYLLDATHQMVNFKSLLLASFIIGTLGILDDIVIGQLEAVKQIRLANPKLSDLQTFKMSIAVGRSHLGAIINTLFLAYVGASFPLILLFSLGNAPFVSFSDVINNEEVATEIVRTLIGVIGLCLAVPISTLLGVWFLREEKNGII